MHVRQLKVERKLSLAASQTALEEEVKAKPKSKEKVKAKKSLKSPKAKVITAWSQAQGGSHSTCTHGKLRVTVGKEGVKAQRP
ncbi:hypothetical protein N300_02509, partial [Calypte anna]